MKTSSNHNDIYIGRNIGQELMRLIKSAKKSVKIVSPYLSASYVKELVELSKKGKDVTLITCDKIIGEGRYSDLTIKDLVKETRIDEPNKKKSRKRGLFLGLILILSSLVLFSFSFQIVLFVSLGLFVIAVCILIYYYFKKPYRLVYDPIFRIKVFDSTSGAKPWSTELIHSKIYIIDEKLAYLGSANFSYSGFKMHYESLIEIQDPRAIRDISKEVEHLYFSKDLREKPIEEWI